MSGPTEQMQEQLVNAAASAPIISYIGVNLVTLNDLLETATLTLGFLTGIIALLFQLRRYIRSRRRDRAEAEDKE